MNMLLQRLSAGLTMTIVPIFARYQSFNKVFEPNWSVFQQCPCVGLLTSFRTVHVSLL